MGEVVFYAKAFTFGAAGLSKLSKQLKESSRSVDLVEEYSKAESKSALDILTGLAISLSLSAPALPSLVHALSLWLSRPGAQSLTVTTTKNGVSKEVCVRAEGLRPNETIDAIKVILENA